MWFIKVKWIWLLYNITYNDKITLSMFHLQWPKVVSKQWMERDRGRILWVPITLSTTPLLLFLQLFQLRSLQQQNLKVSSRVKVAHSVLRVKIILKPRKPPNGFFHLFLHFADFSGHSLALQLNDGIPISKRTFQLVKFLLTLVSKLYFEPGRSDVSFVPCRLIAPMVISLVCLLHRPRRLFQSTHWSWPLTEGKGEKS